MRILTILILLFSTGLWAQDSAKTKTAEMKDDVKVVIKKAGEALNVEKMKGTKSIVQKANLTVTNMAINGKITVTLKDDKIRIESKTAQMNEVQAFNGKDAWAENLAMGLRMIKGPEKLNLIAETLPFTFNPEKFYDKIELLGEEDFSGVKCYKIKSSKEGMDPVLEYVDVKTFLVKGEERTVPSPMGKMKTKTVYTEYTKHEKGFSYPSKMVQYVGPISMEVAITEFKLNQEVDDKIFNVPAQ